MRTMSFKTRLYVIAAVILFAGLTTAVVIYLTAGEDPGNALGYMIIDGQAYPVRHDQSKMYRHDMELYGGKWNVFADQLARGFVGLWQGRTLAFTIAGITAVISCMVFCIARRQNE